MKFPFKFVFRVFLRVPVFFLFTVIFGILFIMPVGAEPIEVEIIADSGYAPYTYEENGQATGIYVAIMDEVFNKLDGYKVTIKAIPWKRGLKMLEKGKKLGILPPYKKTKQRPYLSPYSEPIFLEQVVVYCRQSIIDEKERSVWPDDYYGLKIGTNLAFLLGGDAFDLAVEEGKIIKVEAWDTETALKQLIGGRTECYVHSKAGIIWALEKLKKTGFVQKYFKDPIRISTVPFKDWGYLAYTNRDMGAFPFKTDFILKVDAIIKAMKKSGRIEQITNEFLNRSGTS